MLDVRFAYRGDIDFPGQLGRAGRRKVGHVRPQACGYASLARRDARTQGIEIGCTCFAQMAAAPAHRIDRDGPDGSTHEVRILTIRRMTIGWHIIIDEPATTSPDGAPPLLGLSPLNKIGRFTIDSKAGRLTFGGTP